MNYYYEKDISGCGLVGIMNKSGKRFNGEAIMTSIACMRERANGLGGGFAAYGIYPNFSDYYAFHLMYETDKAKKITEDFLKENFVIEKDETIPTRQINEIRYQPCLWRYFLKPQIIPNEANHRSSASGSRSDAEAFTTFGTQIMPNAVIQRSCTSASRRITGEVSTFGKTTDYTDEEDFVVKCVMFINAKIPDAFVASSGKNMGIFKGVGFPEDIGRFFRLQEYEGYIWTSHGRFPTNTVGWWGGAHPFGLLDWSVIHNGEISSYGINKRYLQNFGYHCTLFTDTEVMTYLFDLLVRKHKLTFEVIGDILAAPLWDEIERENEDRRALLEALRLTYGSALVNGPFAVIVANKNTMVGLNDRIKLRPLIAASKDDFLYIASEESAIRETCPNPDKVWMPKAGEPTIGRLNKVY